MPCAGHLGLGEVLQEVIPDSSGRDIWDRTLLHPPSIQQPACFIRMLVNMAPLLACPHCVMVLLVCAAGSPDGARKRKREEGEEETTDAQPPGQPGSESPQKIKREDGSQKAAGPPGLNASKGSLPPGLAGSGSPPGLPPKGAADGSKAAVAPSAQQSAAAASKKGGPSAADVAAAVAAVPAEPGGQQAGGVKVKQEAHMSRTNSDLTLGISSDQEANVGVRDCSGAGCLCCAAA